ncbi:hypothetical protein JMI89_11395 [Frischella sp. Ac48]|uniref:hypothetical protein n=1 Tax=Frischella sp. Ac48 TaxID=2804531 RepID=UPI001C7CCBCA|nr:hypothetical protein [Frischella sp. Ac48]MBX4134230.1 hypothetical protein [Frischella sp. Ac48]
MSLCVAAAVGRAGVGAPLAAVIGLVALDNIQAGARLMWSNEVTATHGGELIEWSGLLAKGYGEIAYTLIDIGLITKASSVVKMATQTENVIKLNTTTAVKVGQTIKPTEVTISIDKISLNQKNVIELKEFNVGKGNISSEKALSVSEKRAIKALEEQIQLHEKKLKEYIKDPYSFDNKDFLKNAPNDEVRQNIINSRIKHLEHEINTFKKNIDKIKKGKD